MATQNRRSRSTTSASTRSVHRPPSQASTTSMRSSTTQPTHDTSAHFTQYSTASRLPDHGLAGGAPFEPVDAALLQAAHAFSNSDVIALDPALHGPGPQAPDHSPRLGMQYGQLGDTTNHFDQMQEMDFSQTLHTAHIPAPSGAETDDKRKRGPATSATNDRELRELLAQNEGRTLKAVAAEVIATERTSRAERTKQLFAMLWLKSVCRVAKTSVPRSRVYSSYADRCGTERVVPLNPASFGKLVRVIFPGIQTRRLGVRGESKYHYVDLTLLDEQQQESNELERARRHEGRTRHPSVSTQIDFNSIPRLPADTAVLPTPQDHFFEMPQHRPQTGPPSQGRLFTNPYMPGLGSSDGSTSDRYEYTLKFPPPDLEACDEDEPIVLPDIQLYMPPNTDVDAANALTALYRTHCTSLVDCVRFCKEKQFFRLFTSFHGTLTVPVQKLLGHPSIAPWIKECDWLMYQKMIRVVSRLTLQVVPPIVLKFLDNVSKNLHAHISRTFQGSPLHVLEARLHPATLFAQLLHRMLRVNQAAHAAAALLIVDQYRDAMWHDWVMLVNPKRIMESELPNCGDEEVYRILTHDIRTLLRPLHTQIGLENGTHYEQAAAEANGSGMNGHISTDTVIDRIAAFLNSLPIRFPQVNTRTLLHCISAIGTAALREITVENGNSYNPWWITKVFVDEMSLWLASLGGFLDHKPSEFPNFPTRASPLEQSFGKDSIDGGSNAHAIGGISDVTNFGTDFNSNVNFVSATDGAVQPLPQPQNNSNGNLHHYSHSFDQSHFQSTVSYPTNPQSHAVREESDHDDSGIGMGLMDEGSMKFGDSDIHGNGALPAHVQFAGGTPPLG